MALSEADGAVAAHPSFIEGQILAKADKALRRSGDPARWRRITEQAVLRVRPQVLILAPEAAGLRAAWALGQANRTRAFARFVHGSGGRHRALLRGALHAQPVTVRELEPSQRGGLAATARKALASRRRESRGLLVAFLSAGWPPSDLARLRQDRAVLAAGARWRGCYLLANNKAFRLSLSAPQRSARYQVHWPAPMRGAR